jgi:hypothetical protein
MAGKAKRDPKVEGSNFLNEVLAKSGLAGEKAEQFKSLIADADFAPIVEQIGGGTLRQSEFSKGMDELRQWHKDMSEWWRENEGKAKGYDALKAENDRLKAQGAVLDDDDLDEERRRPTLDPSRFVSKEDFDKAVAQQLQQKEQEFLRFNALSQKLAMNHFKEFGEVLDLDEVISHASETRQQLLPAYSDMVRERREKKQGEDLKARLDAARAEGAAEERKKFSGVPFVAKPTVPSTLDGLEAKEGQKAPDLSIDALVAQHNELAARRS